MKRLSFGVWLRRFDCVGIAVLLSLVLAGVSALPAPARSEDSQQSRKPVVCTTDCRPDRSADNEPAGSARWGTLLPSSLVPAMTRIPPATEAGCIEEGQTCVLNGTPCCGSYECKGSFPNTTCQ
jgi:hypothetical protein